MVDTITTTLRSQNMAKIRSVDTRPEMIVRRLVHSMGYRYRLHRKNLPGKPDLVLSGLRKVIFVHGCFWHQHNDPECRITRRPKSNRDYWIPKLTRNVARDKAHQRKLLELGWDVLVIWECQVSVLDVLKAKLKRFLGSRT